MKLLSLFAAALVLAAPPAFAAEDAPRGYKPLSELAELQEKAAKEKKLVVVLVKGSQDDCPHCASAIESGEKVAGSGTLKLFARAGAMNSMDKSKLPAALKERAEKSFMDGAAVTFLVFDPAMTKLVAEAGRDELNGNKEGTAAFKKAVQQAKKDLK